MKNPLYPEPRDVLDDASTLLGVLFEALEAGTLHAREVFEMEGYRAEKSYVSLHAHLVRGKALQVLRQAGVRAFGLDGSESGGEPVELGAMSNCGIKIWTPKYLFRVLKGRNGKLPHAGSSKTRQEEWKQSAFTFEELEHGRLTLVVLWDVTRRLKLNRVMLVCPKSAGTFWNPADRVWSIETPHPAMRAGMGASAPNKSAQEADFELDIRPLEEDENEQQAE